MHSAARSLTLGPLAIALVSDALGGARHGFMLATAIAALLACGLGLNWLQRPAHAQLARFSSSAATLA